VTGEEWQCGDLQTPRLAELRDRVGKKARRKSPPRLREVVADVQKLHCDVENAGAMFQVASQFNLLEMIGPDRVPEMGVGIYESDPTQGPACAIACGAGTIYRNYFAEVNGQVGQSSHNQIDCLSDLGSRLGNRGEKLWRMTNGYALPSDAGVPYLTGIAEQYACETTCDAPLSSSHNQIDCLSDLGSRLGNRGEKLWRMTNGYALPSDEGLEAVNRQLAAMEEAERDELRGLLRIGLHLDTQVTLKGASHVVSQAYCSAMPVRYGTPASERWRPLATLVLEAAYEATILAAIENAERTRINRLFLTLLGGGAFGNMTAWITDAISRAVLRYPHSGLDIAIVSYGQSKPTTHDHVERLNQQLRSEPEA
ncbi:Uncharacterized protein SCF082_LOCUS31929, partial [Durusdinium trenchii]